MIDWTEITDGDSWELFARDFLSEMGFVVEIAPGRGADGGRDLIVSEQLKGTLHSKKFKWLVSCKHLAGSGAAVGNQEIDITDRCKRNDAKGFIGFYSTMASAGLIDRLKDLRAKNEIEAFEIFDHRRIEARVVAAGMTKLVLRYTPKSYGKLRPIQNFFGKYTSVNCPICGKDVLASSVTKPFEANVIWAFSDSGDTCEEVHVVCKVSCDEKMSQRLQKKNYTTGWEDVEDFCNPIIYLKKTMEYMN